MHRKTFIKTSLLAGAALSLGGILPKEKTHILTLSFDDGFKKSFYNAAAIHEKYGLKACLNIIASGHLLSFDRDLKWMPPKEMGNFEDWNRLKKRGHEIMPHTWEHLNLTEIPLEKAKQKIDQCLDYFEDHLEGFVTSEAVFNFAYNASNESLEKYTLNRVRAIRTGGWSLDKKGQRANPFPSSTSPLKLGCFGHGPDYCDNFIEDEVTTFLNSTGGWLILNLHGLDDEGWGPLRSTYLDELLKRLVKINYLDILPAGEVLKIYG